MALWFRRPGKRGAKELPPATPESPAAAEGQEVQKSPEGLAAEADAAAAEAGSSPVAETGGSGPVILPDTALWTTWEPPPSPETTSAGGIAADAPPGDQETPPEELPAAKVGLWRRLRARLGRTREAFSDGLERLFVRRRVIDEELLEELEELLITADLGVETTLRLIEALRGKVKRRELQDVARLKAALKEEMIHFLGPCLPVEMTVSPWVVLLVGVNGVGKTTTIAKLAHQDCLAGRRPLLVAADTFRAAAVEQLEVWGQRLGVEVIKQKSGADPAAVVYDGLAAAQARGVDVVYIDTAGRLHTRVNLMAELKKIHRTAAKKLPGAPHEVLLILDATTGQNAISQARLFQEAVGVTGIILTKLDGTAKGGVVLAVAQETGLPIRYVGIGETLEDLKSFDPEAFVAAILA